MKKFIFPLLILKLLLASPTDTIYLNRDWLGDNTHMEFYDKYRLQQVTPDWCYYVWSYDRGMWDMGGHSEVDIVTKFIGVRTKDIEKDLLYRNAYVYDIANSLLEVGTAYVETEAGFKREVTFYIIIN